MKEKPILKIWAGRNGKMMVTAKFTVDGNLFEKTMGLIEKTGVFIDLSELLADLLRKWLESNGVPLISTEDHEKWEQEYEDKRGKVEPKFGNADIQNSIINLMRETGIPVDVEFVAQKLAIGWGTARAILLNLVVEGKVHMEKTTKSFIFLLNIKEASKDDCLA
jgi:hypothetical protein